MQLKHVNKASLLIFLIPHSQESRNVTYGADSYVTDTRAGRTHWITLDGPKFFELCLTATVLSVCAIRLHLRVNHLLLCSVKYMSPRTLSHKAKYIRT